MSSTPRRSSVRPLLSLLLASSLAACASEPAGQSPDGEGSEMGSGGSPGNPGSGGAGTGGVVTTGGTGGRVGTGGVTAGSGGVAAGSGGAGTGGSRVGAGGARDGGTDAGVSPGTGGARDGGPAGSGGAADGGSPDGGSTAPGVRIVGRTAPGPGGATRFEWSGVSIAARFTGTQVSMQLNDGANKNEFAVIIDGTVRPKIVTASGQTTYALATGLAAGTHDLLIWRRTEGKWGATDFMGLTGFSAAGALLPPPPAPAHRLEIIGDSITSGVGIEQTGTCSGTEDNENNYLAYGSVAARSLGADVVTIAWQGIGMYRNYNQAAPVAGDPTMPQRYDYSIPTSMTAWDFTQYQPDAVVINLTSNDFSTNGDPGTPYISTYVSFIQHVRSKYPNAYFFCVVEYSNGTLSSATDTTQIVNMVRTGGDPKIEAFDIRPYANGNACEGHPDTAGGTAMGNALAAEIKRVLGW